MALVTKIERNWRRPVETEDLEATAIIEISDSGEVSKFDIENSSGDSNFDESIRKAVYSASPFSELEGLSKKDLEKFDKVKLIFKQK